MTTKKIYGHWIKWDGGECPVPPETIVEVKLRDGEVLGPDPAKTYRWYNEPDDGDIVKYPIVIEQPDLEAAEQLLRDNGYTITPPAKPLTFEDVVPMTEAPQEGTAYWVASAREREGVYIAYFYGTSSDHRIIKRRMAYLDKEQALVAARHVFGLKGGEL